MDKVFSQIKKSLIKSELKNKCILVAISGGVDSTVLLYALNYFKQSFKLKLRAIYIHHGDSTEKSVKKFRDKSEVFLRNLCRKYRIPFFAVMAADRLTSEDEFRDFRYSELFKHAKLNECEVIAVAHHEDDLLETRLIRLIRGVSTGGLESMSEFKDKIWRPFLPLSRKEILDFANLKKINFLNDPTNKNKKYFRNWIRNKWLPELESYRPGSLRSLSRSLENLSVKKSLKISNLLSEQGISRVELISKSRSVQRQILVEFLKKKKIKNYTSSQIDEILKRIDSSKKELKFRVVRCDWTVDTKHINCRAIVNE